VGRFEEVEPGYIHVDVKELPKLPEEPKTYGLVEQFNVRIIDILKQLYFTDYKKLMDRLNQYIYCYNYVHRQKVLNNKSSAEKLREWYDKTPSLFKSPFNPSNYNLLHPDM